MNLYELVLDDYYKPKIKKLREIKGNRKIVKTEDAVELCNNNFGLDKLAQENVYLICLNTDQDIMGVFLVSKGSADMSIVGKREIFIEILLTGSSRFILVHNHPNNNKDISQQDINITNQLKFIAVTLEVEFLDHIIITRSGYTSMKHDGMI